jgi:hypothetical protein
MQDLARRVREYPGNTGFTAALFLLVISSAAAAQPAGVKTQGGDSRTERLIASSKPHDHAVLSALLKRLLGKAECEPLVHSQSEVWTVPQTKIDELKQELAALGVKFDHLRENWNHILRRGETKMTREQEEALAKVRQSPAMVGIAVMRATEAAVAEYALTGGPEGEASRIVIPISDTQLVTLLRSSAVRTDKGVIWRGAVEDTGETAILRWWKDGNLNGLFDYKGRIYTVMDMGGELHAVSEADPSKLPPDHPADPRQTDGQIQSRPEAPRPKVEPISASDLQTLQAKNIVIDVMMLYTKRAASHYMRNPAEVMELSIERANDTFRNSGLGNIQLRLVHTEAVDYEEQNSEEFIDLYQMVDGDGPFKNVRRLRDEKRADIVGLIIDDPKGCGLSTRVAPDAEDAYFVVHYACAALTITVAHEIGHILGARHDRRVDPTNSPFPYGHGYVNGTKWRDIMSYAESCGGCLRIPFWSNPRVLYKGEPTGSLTEDNARAILERAELVSKFR